MTITLAQQLALAGPYSELPILFNTAMVLANLAGIKNQTRRIIKDCNLEAFYPDDILKAHDGSYIAWQGIAPRSYNERMTKKMSGGFRSPYGEPGSYLWVRETHAIETFDDGRQRVIYKADHAARWLDQAGNPTGDTFFLPSDYKPAQGYKPSIFMRRAFSRILLKVIAYEPQRLQEITEDDARGEGVSLPECNYMGHCNSSRCPRHCENAHRDAFHTLWDSINASRSRLYIWSANPWVWRVQFERVQEVAA